MMAKRTIIVVAMLVCCGCLSAVAFRPWRSASDASGPAWRLSLQPCTLPRLDGEARCGTYEVFEDRAAKSGRTIKLKIVVLKALSSTPKPDAVFPLNGGPGAPSTQLVALVRGGILGPARQDHDLVFVDQRGTGGSNPLNCDVGDDPHDLAGFFGEILPRDKVRACREKLQQRSSFVERVRLAMYSTPTQSFVPLIIHRAYLNDYVPFEQAAMRFSPGPGISRGVYFTITCSEGVPFITDQDVVTETHGTFVGEERVKRHQEACREWPKGDIPASYIDPVKSDLPVLMISGEVDGSSPPWFGESAVKFLTNGRQLKIRYLGHQIDSPCLQDIFKNFITAGSSKQIDAGCTTGIRRPALATEIPPWFAFQ